MKVKKILTIITVCVVLAVTVGAVSYVGNWPVRYKKEFDKFFGSNWSWEKLEPTFDDNLGSGTNYRSGRFKGMSSGKSSGLVSHWGITCEDDYYEVTDWAHKYNHKKYFPLFSKKWLNGKQSLWYEFLDIAIEKSYLELEKRYIEDVIGAEYCEAIDMELQYNTSPKKEFLKYLSKSNWLSVNTTVSELMSCDKHDFVIDIRLYDYQYEKLNKQQKEIVDKWFNDIESKLLDDFGDEASFYIYYNPNDDEENVYRVEYFKGQMVE